MIAEDGASLLETIWGCGVGRGEAGLRFLGPRTRTHACYFAMKTAPDHRFCNLIVEGDLQGLMEKLQKQVPNNALSFLDLDILALSDRFNFVF